MSVSFPKTRGLRYEGFSFHTKYFDFTSEFLFVHRLSRTVYLDLQGTFIESFNSLSDFTESLPEN